MKITIQFALALAFAVAAAGLNWFYLSMKTTPRTTSFVIVAEEIKPGERIVASKLAEFKVVQLDDDQTDLTERSLIPFFERQILFNLESPRGYKKGDFILSQDLQQSSAPELDYLGPFRLLSVGDQLTSQIGNDRGSGQVLTLAVNKDYDDKTRRLIQVIEKQKESRNFDGSFRLLGVQVLRRTSDPVEPGTVRRLDLQEDEVAMFVDISDLDSVPSILSVGDQIRFTIPKFSNLAEK